MREYIYDGFTPGGQATQGKVSAPSEAEARDLLRNGGTIITEIRPAKAEMGQKEIHLRKPKVKLKDIAWFSRNMCTTQQAGLPVLRAMGMLARQKQGTAIGTVLADVEAHIAEGQPLGASFREHQDQMGPLACAMIEAGEASGSLELAFDRIARFTESQLSVRRKIIGAIAYPAAVMGLAGFLMVAVLLFVVPTFKDLYASLGSDSLPAPTELLLKASDWSKIGIPLFIISIPFIRMTYRTLKKQDEWARRFDRAKMRAPLFGGLVESTALGRVCSSMASLLTAGVSLLDALELTAEISNNALFAKDLRSALREVEQGRTLTAAFTSADVFPELFVQLVAVGDETGALPDLLERYSLVLEEEVQVKVETLTSLIEPLMIVFLGGGVGAMLVALYVPMFKVIELIK